MNEPTPGTGQRPEPEPGSGSEQPPVGPDAPGISSAQAGERTEAPVPEDEARASGGSQVPEGGTRQPGEDPQESQEPEEAPEAEPEEAGPDEADSEAPRPLGLGTKPTGHPPVDAQLRRLADVDHLAVSGHQEVYEDVHRGLRDTLAALDSHDSGS